MSKLWKGFALLGVTAALVFMLGTCCGCSVWEYLDTNYALNDMNNGYEVSQRIKHIQQNREMACLDKATGIADILVEAYPKSNTYIVIVTHDGGTWIHAVIEFNGIYVDTNWVSAAVDDMGEWLGYEVYRQKWHRGAEFDIFGYTAAWREFWK